MSRRKRLRYWRADRVAEGLGGRPLGDELGRRGRRREVERAVRPLAAAVAARAASGRRASRPGATCAQVRAGPGLRGRAAGRWACAPRRRTHSRIAVRAGTATVLPGSVTVSCWRPAFFRAKSLIAHGARLMSPLSPMSRPWFGSKRLVARRAGGGRRRSGRVASAPGPDTLRMLSSKSSTSSKIGRVVRATRWSSGLLRVEGAVERHRLARAVGERPDDAVGQALEVAARAVLPALAREPVVGRDRRAGRAGRSCRARRRTSPRRPARPPRSSPAAGSARGADDLRIDRVGRAGRPRRRCARRSSSRRRACPPG